MNSWKSNTIALCCLSVAAWGQADRPPYLNPDLPAEQRAADVVSRMTLEEKVLQMQNTAPAIPRLNIPAYDWWNEALHGVARAGQATVFPQAIGLAATWDTELIRRVADTISTEARAKYHDAIRRGNYSRSYGLTFWSPNVNIFRDPRWGRGQETYGEDPYLTGRLAVSFVQGLQGNDPHYFKVIATPKHFAVHSGPEPLRHQFNVNVSERDLRETYLPAFRASIVEGKADSVMCAYNSVDGAPACANRELLQKILRGEWGFQGYVVSDCAAIRDISNGHKYKATEAEASAVAVKTGTDLTCGNEYRSLVEAVREGLVTEAEINRSLERLFVARFRLGMFDPPERVPYSKIPYSEVDSAAHRRLALDTARESIVLLKNDGTLPLRPSVKKIAVIGPSADDPDALLGNYNGVSSKQVTPRQGMEKQFAGKAAVRFALGSTYTPELPVLVPSEVLMPPRGSGPGLLAEYFDNAELRGAPKLQRVEPRPLLEIPFVDPAVAAAIPSRGFSVRWRGTLRPSLTGDYALSARGGFGPSRVRIFLDDRELVPPGAASENAPLGRGQIAPAVHVPLEAGHAYNIRVEYATQGAATNVRLLWIPPAGPLLTEAVEAVKNSDVAVAFLGLTPNLEGEEMRISIPGFSGGDRTDLNLPASQERLLEAAVATGKPVVVVLTSGSALAVNYAAEHAAAVLEARYAGEETGTAIAETLAGRNNPAGRLPLTFYRGVDQLPPFEDYSMTGRTYRYFQGEPLYGFGFGLSYSRFQYSGLRAQRTASGAQVSVRVKNDSAQQGDEVVQLYVAGGGAPSDPVRQLRGFRRVRLKPGETSAVEFELNASDIPKTPVRIGVGGGQPVGAIPHVEGTL